MRQLRRMLNAKPLVRVMEAHNGLTGLIVENARIEESSIAREFDAMWLSSLTDSTAKGRPDIEYVDLTSRTTTIQDIMEVTTKPIISMALTLEASWSLLDISTSKGRYAFMFMPRP